MINDLITLIKNNQNIVIYGDLIIDKFINVKTKRLSSETMIPVMEPDNIKISLGGSGNLLKFLNNFNKSLFFFSAISNDNKKYLKENICYNNSIFIENFNQTKTRFINLNNQYFRYDECDIFNYEEHKLIIENNFKNCIQNNNIDIVIISDYLLGFCSNLDNIIKICNENNIKTLIDPHCTHLKKYLNCTIFKPNLKELEYFSKLSIKDNNDIKRACDHIKSKIKCESIIVTLGPRGIYYHNDNIIINQEKVQSFIDVCGAGDIVTSIISLGIINNLNMVNILKIANLYALISVKKLGTSEILFHEVLFYINKPYIINLNQLNILLNNSYDLKIGITSGCFDIIHCGHIQSLKFFKKKCDILIVFLNSDLSIKKLKGDNRPINNLEYRLNYLKELNFIDFIIIFDDTNVFNVINDIKFNIFFKGGDYNINDLEKKLLNKNIEIITSDFCEGISTSKIIENIINK